MKLETVFKNKPFDAIRNAVKQEWGMPFQNSRQGTNSLNCWQGMCLEILICGSGVGFAP